MLYKSYFRLRIISATILHYARKCNIDFNDEVAK